MSLKDALLLEITLLSYYLWLSSFAWVQVRVSENYGLKFPREFGLLLKQLLYFDRYTKLLAPTLNVLEDDRIRLGNRTTSFGDTSAFGSRMSGY